MTTIEKIQQLDDFKVLRLYEHLSTLLFEATDADVATLTQHMPADIAATPEIQQVQKADEAVFEEPMDNTEAVAFARQSLTLLATDPATEPLIADTLQNWKDDSMIAGTILAIGAAISLVMLLATSEISYDKKHGLRIGIGTIKQKDQVDARRRVIESLFKIIPKLRGMLGK